MVGTGSRTADRYTGTVGSLPVGMRGLSGTPLYPATNLSLCYKGSPFYVYRMAAASFWLASCTTSDSLTEVVVASGKVRRLEIC